MQQTQSILGSAHPSCITRLHCSLHSEHTQHHTQTSHAVMPCSTNKQPDTHQLQFKIIEYYKHTVYCKIAYGEFSLYVTDVFTLHTAFCSPINNGITMKYTRLIFSYDSSACKYQIRLSLDCTIRQQAYPFNQHENLHSSLLNGKKCNNK